MPKVVKHRKTRSDIQPERLVVRLAIAFKQQAGRTRLSVSEIAREALSKVVSEHSERLGALALAGMKDVVRQELARSDASGNPAWVSTGIGGAAAREYVHASVASGAALQDTIAYRKDFMDAMRSKVESLAVLLDYAQQHSCSVQDAILALHPDAEEQEIEEIVDALEAIS